MACALPIPPSTSKHVSHERSPSVKQCSGQSWPAAAPHAGLRALADAPSDAGVDDNARVKVAPVRVCPYAGRIDARMARPHYPVVSMQDRLNFRLLGGFGVTIANRAAPPIHISSPRQRALLAYLALQPDYSESRERLATLLWGDSTDGQARKRFRQSLLRLRREFAGAGADPLVGDRDTLALNPAMVSVDAREFLELSRSGIEADLNKALDLYRGDLLDGIS